MFHMDWKESPKNMLERGSYFVHNGWWAEPTLVNQMCFFARVWGFRHSFRGSKEQNDSP